MADIFISYSRKDSAQAIELAERLRVDGMDVWIDQHGIAGAEQWATEIVEGIRDCSTFIILLSPNSIESENVLRELSLASEKRKRVLPVDIEPTVLPSSFEYPLAGLQRVPFADFDRIVHAHKHGIEKVIKKDERKSLMILPFEDLSPTGDNGWFADGIVSELISALSNVKSIRIADNQATKEFKKYNGQLTTYAKEMNFRHFVQGDVRKFGDNIKISVWLLDIETGDHLWQDSMKGVMNDIFDIQEKVAEKVVEGLKVHLASDEKKKLAERGTENAEAYELYLKAVEYFNRMTKEGIRLAVQLITEAIHLDPGYAQAFHFKANALAVIYHLYDRNAELLDEAEALAKEALRLKPDMFGVYYPLSQIYMHRGQTSEAEKTAKEYIRKDPQNPNSHFSLGFFYWSTGQPAKAIPAFEEAVRLKPDHLVSLFNLVVNCDNAKEREKCAHWAEVALPYYERHLKLHPDDETRLVHHATLLFHTGRTEAAHAAAIKLNNLKDGKSLYNNACIFGMLGDTAEALVAFRKAIEAGFKYIQLLKGFLADEKMGIAALAGTPEYEEVRGMVAALEGNG
jgi:TolB-like protein/Flp pilus assembly protein TadD